jgi:hypothetical protein
MDNTTVILLFVMGIVVLGLLAWLLLESTTPPPPRLVIAPTPSLASPPTDAGLQSILDFLRARGTYANGTPWDDGAWAALSSGTLTFWSPTQEIPPRYFLSVPQVTGSWQIFYNPLINAWDLASR